MAPLHCPSELWLQSAPVEVLLGDRVPYSSVALPRALAQALGLMTELKPVSVVALLGEWSLKKGGHVASLQRMSALYRWLHPRIVDDAPLRKQLAESASIWLPTSREAPDGTAVVVGHFYHPLQCVWRGFELTRSLGDAAHTPRKTNEVRALHSFYAGVAEETFVALGVPNKLMLSQYAGFLLHEATSGPPTPAIIRRIYSVFGQLGRVGTAVTRNSIETVLGDAAVFPVASGGWQRLGQLFFSLPARGERGGEGGGQHEERSEGASAASERTLMHAIEVQPEVQVEDIQGVQFFLRNVLQLPTLQECSRLIITTVPTQPLRTTSAAQSARLCAAACAIQRLTSSCMAPEARDEIMWRLRSMEVRLTSEIHYCSKVHAPGGEVFELSPSRESRCLLLLPRTGAEASGGADKKRMREEWGELHGRGQGHLPAVQEVHTVPGEGGKKKLRSSVQSTDINSTSALSTQDWPPSGLPAPGPSTPAPPPAGTRDPVILYLTPAVTPRDVVREVCRLLSLEVRAEATLLLFSVLLRAWDWEGEPPQPQRMRQLCYGPMAEFEQLPPLAATEVWWLTPLVMNAPGDAEGMGVGGASDVDLASELSSALQRERAFLAEHESAREEGGEFARPGRAGTSAAGGTPAIPGEEGLDHALQRAVASSRPRARSVLAAGSLAGDTEEYSLQSTPGAATAALLSSTTSSSVRWEVQALTPELLACSTAGFSVEDRKAVGRWGEHFVFEHLCRAMPAAKVRWVNSDAETGLPYDLTVVPSASARVFIEVKTSAALRKPFFEVGRGSTASVCCLLLAAHCSLLAAHCARPSPRRLGLF